MDDIQILKLVGTGGFGSVYLGRYQESEVAIKVIPERSKASVFDLATELAVMSTLSHPSIVQVGLLCEMCPGNCQGGGRDGSAPLVIKQCAYSSHLQPFVC